MRSLKDVIKAFKLCKSTNCKNCPYYRAPENYVDIFCLGTEKDEDALYYLEAYKDGFHALNKLEEDLKLEKEKYNEAIQHCNRMENKYKTMINNFIKENENYLTEKEK